jgi:hypothetical protein
VIDGTALSSFITEGRSPLLGLMDPSNVDAIAIIIYCTIVHIVRFLELRTRVPKISKCKNMFCTISYFLKNNVSISEAKNYSVRTIIATRFACTNDVNQYLLQNGNMEFQHRDGGWGEKLKQPLESYLLTMWSYYQVRLHCFGPDLNRRPLRYRM